MCEGLSTFSRIKRRAITGCTFGFKGRRVNTAKSSAKLCAQVKVLISPAMAWLNQGKARLMSAHQVGNPSLSLRSSRTCCTPLLSDALDAAVPAC